LILNLFSWISGRPGADYPILGEVPYTNFYCDEQSYPGFFADMETRCQVKIKKQNHHVNIFIRMTRFSSANAWTKDCVATYAIVLQDLKLLILPLQVVRKKREFYWKTMLCGLQARNFMDTCFNKPIISMFVQLVKFTFPCFENLYTYFLYNSY